MTAGLLLTILSRLFVTKEERKQSIGIATEFGDEYIRATIACVISDFPVSNGDGTFEECLLLCDEDEKNPGFEYYDMDVDSMIKMLWSVNKDTSVVIGLYRKPGFYIASDINSIIEVDGKRYLSDFILN